MSDFLITTKFSFFWCQKFDNSKFKFSRASLIPFHCSNGELWFSLKTTEVSNVLSLCLLFVNLTNCFFNYFLYFQWISVLYMEKVGKIKYVVLRLGCLTVIEVCIGGAGDNNRIKTFKNMKFYSIVIDTNQMTKLVLPLKNFWICWSPSLIGTINWSIYKYKVLCIMKK